MLGTKELLLNGVIYISPRNYANREIGVPRGRQKKDCEDEGLGLVWGDVELDQVGFETLCFGGAVGYAYGHPDGAQEHGVAA